MSTSNLSRSGIALAMLAVLLLAAGCASSESAASDADTDRGGEETVAVGAAVNGSQVELASGKRLVGPVTFIEPEAGFATQRDVSRVKRDIRTFGLKVALENPDRRAHHGMTAYVLLPGEQASPAVGD